MCWWSGTTLAEDAGLADDDSWWQILVYSSSLWNGIYFKSKDMGVWIT